MKTHVDKLLLPFRDLGWLSFLVVAVGVASIVGMIHAQNALAVQSAADYCSKYTSNSEKNACRDGINGTDCQNYIDAGFGQEVADICTKAAQDVVKGVVTPGDVSVPASPSPSPSSSPSSSPSTSPSPSSSPSTSPSSSPSSSPSASPSTSPSSAPSGADATQLQNLLDQAKSLSQYIDILHQAGPDASVDTNSKADNEVGSYTNGAGKKQQIRTINPGKGGSPAILFFNGGGWHADDHSSDFIFKQGDAPGRGYAMFDVTYRLGSSGVYYMFEDVMRGIQHMRNNADKYGIDPNKIVIWGDSAGGSLAMRAAASGKSGAKAAVGWSAPTNAYTALFKSFQSFGIGIDHSTCVPTDLAGFANFANLLNGGSGDVAQYGMGLSSNDFTSLGINGDLTTGSMDPLALLTEGMVAGKNLLSAAGDVESISSQINSGLQSSSNGSGLSGFSGLSGSAFNMASKKFAECIDNFNVLSPALFASPDTPPSFLAEFEDDGLIDPDQSYGMRDKLRQLGIHSDALILPGVTGGSDCAEPDPSVGYPGAIAPAGAGGCHLGYYHGFVCPTLNFIDSEIQPEKGTTDCATGIAENAANASSGGAATPVSGGGSGGSSGSGSSSSSGSSSGSGSSTGSGGTGSSTGGSTGTPTNNCGGSLVPGKSSNPGVTNACVETAQQRCTDNGGTYVGNRNGATDVCDYTTNNMCDTWQSSCNGNNTLPTSPQPANCPAGSTAQYVPQQGGGSTYWCKG